MIRDVGGLRMRECLIIIHNKGVYLLGLKVYAKVQIFFFSHEIERLMRNLSTYNIHNVANKA